MAVDAANGKILWQFPTNQGLESLAHSRPTMFDNKQYVAIAVGTDIVSFGLPE